MVPEVILKRFESPDEVRVFQKGRLEVVRIGTMVLGRALYEPGIAPLHGRGPLREEVAATLVERHP